MTALAQLVSEAASTNAYAWLAKELGLHIHDTHIGSFDESTCRRVVKACREREAQERAS